MPTDPPVGARTDLLELVRWAAAALVAAVLTGFAFLLVTGSYRKEGPVVLALSANHGLHLGDLFVLAGWAVSLVAVLLVTVLPARRTPRDAGDADARGAEVLSSG
ncbi:hypothetical protein A7K94_0211060 [Modestobacter sp. VKM Ac-2676]|nr:hypothetical protein A7K94_0211060 [Modestobacter sp. VKM Ac-2676]